MRDNIKNSERVGQVAITDDATANESSPNIQYDITSYGADLDVFGLVRRIDRGDIIIPSFQRAYVWKPDEASRFIESLLLGLPVPGIFLSRENDSNTLLVIDGQQRLKTLQFFLSGYFNPKKDDVKKQIFRLTKVQDRFINKSYQELNDGDRRQLDDAIIHATIVKQESPSGDNTSIFHIFERLNTGGQKLSPQEIRTAICYGEKGDFIEVINDLNGNPKWRSIFGRPNPRLKDEELILRYIALNEEYEKYQRPMGDFLTKFMKSHSNPSDSFVKRIVVNFNRSIEALYDAVGKKAFKPQRAVNAANFDAIMIGLTRNIEHISSMSSDQLKLLYDNLIINQEFTAYTQKSTADEASVKGRINLAIKAFAQ